MKFVDAVLKAPKKKFRIFGIGGDVVEVVPPNDDSRHTEEQEIIQRAEVEQALEDFRRMEYIMSDRDT